MLLRSATGHDFSSYKQSTIIRRIERRLNVHQIDDISKYARYLQRDAHELRVLFRDLLIGVTSFFGGPEAFEALEAKALPQLLENKAVETARAGRYPASIAVDVSGERLKRFFEREDDIFRIKSEIREMLIFSPQSIIRRIRLRP